MKVVSFKWPIYKHVLPMPMNTFIHWYKFKNNEVERILSCKCTVLCYIFEYSYYVQRAKRCKSPVFAFNLQIPDQLECLIVFCMLKANTWLVCLFAICTIYVYSNMYNKVVHLQDEICSTSSFSNLFQCIRLYRKYMYF